MTIIKPIPKILDMDRNGKILGIQHGFYHPDEDGTQTARIFYIHTKPARRLAARSIGPSLALCTTLLVGALSGLSALIDSKHNTLTQKMAVESSLANTVHDDLHNNKLTPMQTQQVTSLIDNFAKQHVNDPSTANLARNYTVDYADMITSEYIYEQTGWKQTAIEKGQLKMLVALFAPSGDIKPLADLKVAIDKIVKPKQLPPTQAPNI